MKPLDDSSFIFLLFHADDMLTVEKCMSVVNLLSKEFDMKDLGAVKKILRMEIHKDKAFRRLWLSQCSYVEKVLDMFSMGNAKTVSTLLVHHFKLSTKNVQ